MATPIGVFCESRESLRSPKRESESRRSIVRKNGDLVRVTQLEGEGKFSYKFGEKYPGLIIGHEKCKDGENALVPKYMGWLWNIETVGIEKIRKGWCPGAVSTPVKEIMKSFLNPCPFTAMKESAERIKCVEEEDEQNKIEKDGNADKDRKYSDETKTSKGSLLCEKCSQKSCRDVETQCEFQDGVIKVEENVRISQTDDGRRKEAKKSTKDSSNKGREKSKEPSEKKKLKAQTDTRKSKNIPESGQKAKASENRKSKALNEREKSKSERNAPKENPKLNNLTTRVTKCEEGRRTKNYDEPKTRLKKGQSLCDFNERSTVEQPPNAANHCATKYNDPCQQNCPNIDVCHGNALKKAMTGQCEFQQRRNYCKSIPNPYDSLTYDYIMNLR